MFRALIERLSNALPSQCALCHAWPSQPLCAGCRASHVRHRPRCAGCALPVPEGVPRCGGCLRHPPPLDACLAAVAYDYPWSNLIGRYKFGPSPGWSATLAGLMADTPGAQQALADAALVLPMPLSRQRLQQRGFNQALELARWLAPTKTRHDVLLRLRDTPAQSSLPRDARLRNVRGAFGVAPDEATRLGGRRVLLVDDVMTSGASLHTAAQALRDAGAAGVSALVLARTE